MTKSHTMVAEPQPRDPWRQKAIDGSRLLLEALRDQHGDLGRPDLILNQREIKAAIARRLDAAREIAR